MRPGGILALVAREVTVLSALGIAIGIVGALAAARLLGALLVGLSATDPVMIAVTTLTLLVVGTVAMLVPARTAMRTDPSVALPVKCDPTLGYACDAGGTTPLSRAYMTSWP